MKYMPEPFRYTVHLQTYQVISNVVPSRIDWLHCWLLHIFILLYPPLPPPIILSCFSLNFSPISAFNKSSILPFKCIPLPFLSLFFLCLVLSLSRPFIWLCNIRQAANSLYTSIRGEPSTHTHKPATDYCLLAEGFVCYPAQTKRLQRERAREWACVQGWQLERVRECGFDISLGNLSHSLHRIKIQETQAHKHIQTRANTHQMAEQHQVFVLHSLAINLSARLLFSV